jgi:WD40 repeat protein
VVAYDGDTGEPIASVAQTALGAASALALDRHGALTVASASSPMVGRWSLEGHGAIVRPIETGGRAPSDLSPDGETLLLEEPDDTRQARYALVETATGSATGAPLPFTHAAFSGDRTLVGVPVAHDRPGFFGAEWDIEAGKAIPPIYEIPTAGYSGEFAVDDDIGLIAIGYDDGTVRFYARLGTEPIGDLHVDGRVRDLDLDGSTGRLLVATARDTVHLFDLASGRETGRPVPGVAAKFRDGRPSRFFVGSSRGDLVEVDARTGAQIGRAFPQLPSAIGDISSTGSLLAATDLDGRFRLFDVASHTQIGADLHPPSTGRSLVADDESFAVLATPDGAEVWSLTVEEWRAAACRLAGRNLTREEWRTHLANSGDHRRTCEQWPAGT